MKTQTKTKEKISIQDKILIGFGYDVILKSIKKVLDRDLTKREIKEIREEYAKELTKGNIIK